MDQGFTRFLRLAPLNLPRIGLSGLFALRRQRDRLQALDRRLLDDLGISPDAATREAGRPFWDVPDTWRR